MKKLTGGVLVVVLAAGCSSAAGPTSGALSGVVTESPGGPVSNATVRLIDGPNAGRATTTSSTGSYGFSDIKSGTTHVSASVEYGDSVKELTLSKGANRLDFNFAAPVFLTSGAADVGWKLPSMSRVAADAVINVPSRVTKIRLSAAFSGQCGRVNISRNGSYLFTVGMGTGNGSPDPDYECDLPPVGTSYEVVLDLASRGGTLAVHFDPGPFYYYGSNYPPLASFSWSVEEVR